MCWLVQNSLDDLGDCDGPMDRMHLIPQQRIKRHLHGNDPVLINRAVWHPHVWVLACRRHHADYDNHRFRISRARVPACVEHYARVMDMQWSLTRDFR